MVSLRSFKSIKVVGGGQKLSLIKTSDNKTIWEKEDNILYEPTFDGTETYTNIVSYSEPITTIGDGVFESKGAYLNDGWYASNDFVLTGEIYLNESSDAGGLMIYSEDSNQNFSSLIQITYYHSKLQTPATGDNSKGIGTYKQWKSFSITKIGTQISITTPRGTANFTRDISALKIHLGLWQWANNGSTSKLRNIKVEKII